MTHAFLQTELTSMISDSKRRYNDVRTAAEQSFADIRTISVTSETQLAGDLSRRPHVIEPFVLACRTKNAKLATSGAACLQRLTASRALPRGRLSEVLDAFHDAVGAGYEAQLKILQTLPSLLQLYANDVRGNVLAKVLELCAVLQSSKTAVVSNTATATFQQLVSTVFEKSDAKDRSKASDESDGSGLADQYVNGAVSDDVIRVFEDLCLLLDQRKPQFLKIDSIPQVFLLETLHTILSSHDTLLLPERHHDTQWSEQLLHGLARNLARKDHFATTARALVVLLIIFHGHAKSLRDEVIQVVPLLVGALERDGNPPWRRAIFLEFFHNLCSDFDVMRELFTTFDSGAESGRIFGQLMSALVRIAAEDPSLIGLGRQSTVPMPRMADPRSEEAASIEAQGLGGAITSVASNDSNTTGISTDWSQVAIPLLEQPDKTAAPGVPSTYIYTLVLGCVSSLCDGLSKFIMPLSVPSRPSKRQSSEQSRRDSAATDRSDNESIRKPIKPTAPSQKYQRLINPLTLTHHRLFDQIHSVADMIDACWPAALATCSTFLNAALDSEYYHNLIRSVQKLAQVSGVLELSTPRDALLTTLAKSSLPANASSIIAASQNTRTNRIVSADSTIHDGLKSPTEPPPTPNFHVSASPLNVRHLLCLRALLNLGIALGPTLGKDAWFILTETMQTVEALIAMPTTVAATSTSISPRIGSSSSDSQNTLATEIAAAQAATKRMLESTKGFSSDSFSDIVQALLRLLGRAGEEISLELPERSLASPTTPTRLGAPRQGHQISRSVSGMWVKSKSLELEVGFVLNKLNDLSRINVYRFASSADHSCTWALIGDRLLRLSQDARIADNHRIQAASILDLVSIETVKVLDDSRFQAEEADDIRSLCFGSLLQQLDYFETTQSGKHDAVELEIHKRLLDALESMLSHSGESLSKCWPIALQILSITYSKTGQNPPYDVHTTVEQAERDEQTAQILRIAFRSIQLIASDFLEVLGVSSLSKLAVLLRQFGTQQYDLNVALTSTTVLWGLASHVLSSIDNIDVRTMPTLGKEDEEPQSQSGSTSGALWSRILFELVELSKDHRADIRNAAIRVLLKMLEASSEHISSSTWAVSLKVGPLETIRYCVSQYAADRRDPAWMASAAQLTDGTTQLVCQNLGVIAEHSGFKNTWLLIMEVLQDMLETNSASASTLAFSSVSKLVSALPILGSVEEDLVQPPIHLWADYHPADIQHDSQPDGSLTVEEPNQQALSSHAHVLVEAYKTSSNAVITYLRDRAPILMDAIERGIMLCTHPPYTSDMKTLAPEQKEICVCISILKELLESNVSEYSRFLLRMLTVTLDIQDATVMVQHKRSAMSKSVQKPSFIAFAAACLDNFRSLILEQVNDGCFVQKLAVLDACPVLSAMISTKYTKLPSNPQAPLWRNATVTAVVMLEALQEQVSNKLPSEDSAQLAALAQQITFISVSIIQPGGLSNPPALEHKAETILEDEVFDIEHFERLHTAIVSIFQLVQEIEEVVCKQYAIVLFRASLIAKPWFYDIPDDLAKEPLKDLMKVRPGSVHRPVFAVRKRICYATLKALFELVQRQEPTHLDENSQQAGSGNDSQSSHKLAAAAAPYLILRVVHPLKTLLADQRLRSLTPPPRPQQVELQTILCKFVDLRSDGQAIHQMAQALSHQNQTDEQTQRTETTSPAALKTHNVTDDGKEHLRILYGMMLRVQKYWRRLPRMEGHGARAWQDEELGRGIVQALERWQIVLAEGWGVQGIEDV